MVILTSNDFNGFQILAVARAASPQNLESDIGSKFPAV